MTPMTTDFYVTKRDGTSTAISLKSSPSVLENRRTVEKLFVEMHYWKTQGIPYELVFKESLNVVLFNNIRQVVEYYSVKRVHDDISVLKHLIATRRIVIPNMDSVPLDFAQLVHVYESFYREKKKQEKLGEEKNRQISVAAYETYRDITATAVEEKMDAPSIKNLIENRKEERFLTNYQNSIESRLTDTELEPVVIEPSVPKQATSLFDVESINPDSCDFWSKVDHASREENRKKQELLRNGGQS